MKKALMLLLLLLTPCVFVFATVTVSPERVTTIDGSRLPVVAVNAFSRHISVDVIALNTRS
ncbi:MAG: hypothetical protein IJR63_06315 [Synergistaceae bacterium]|nr:hypothetical protein [Synergistaceae bacterium]